MGMNDYYKYGSHNFLCDICKRKFKAEDKRINWKGFAVCPQDFELKPPQLIPPKIPKEMQPVNNPRLAEVSFNYVENPYEFGTWGWFSANNWEDLNWFNWEDWDEDILRMR